MDSHSRAQRAYNMSRIRSKDTKPELTVRKYLFSKGFRYKLHSKELPGKPDIVLPKFKSVILVNGCFWHGHEDCKYFVLPKSNMEWWKDKIQKNKARDGENQARLETAGWKVFIVFECELKEHKQETLEKLVKELTAFVQE